VSILITTHVQCDRCGRIKAGTTGAAVDRRTTRRRAQITGWTRRRAIFGDDLVDLCPTHSRALHHARQQEES
jgi:hypothetical protein